METMHLTQPKHVFITPSFHLGGPLNNLACVRKYPKGARSDYQPPHFATPTP